MHVDESGEEILLRAPYSPFGEHWNIRVEMATHKGHHFGDSCEVNVILLGHDLRSKRKQWRKEKCFLTRWEHYTMANQGLPNFSPMS